jgi:hypothetical protein
VGGTRDASEAQTLRASAGREAHATADLDPRGTGAEAALEDTGRGIPAEQLGAIFEHFV